MFVAAGQFAVGPSWEKNAETCALLMSQAAGEGGVATGITGGIVGA